MRITSIKIQNFQCFGSEASIIRLDDLTAFVGMNGAGKTAIMQALVRMFGVPSERRLVRKDFHLPFGQSDASVDSAQLLIEARVDFSEGEEGVAECFNQMAIEGEGKSPYCRIRLEGRWVRSTAVEGDIEEHAYWVTSDAAEPEESAKSPIAHAQRSLIQVNYVPATRDPAKQLRHVSGTVLYKLLKAVEWKPTTKASVKKASDEMRDAITGEVGVTSIQNSISGAWEKLYSLPVHSKVKIQAVTGEFDELLKNVEAVFQPGAAENEAGIDKLSDGMKSLFYFSLIRAGFAIENACRKGESKGDGLSRDELKLAALNVFIIEEPENHLSPHYLGRIIAQLKEMASEPGAQVLVTSQSSGILKRVDPRNVRYVRLKEGIHTSVVCEITLPKEESDGDAFKFVKEAVQAYPELYFSSFVILGEGDSEEIVLPKLAAARNLDLDQGFVSMVPLGGRHVNHFWRLLNDLKIPYVTLLDLDRERGGGGWGRIKTVCDQLLLIDAPKDKLLAITDGVLTDDELSKMHKWKLDDISDNKDLEAWCTDLEEFGVYFSSPLDLDYLMYSAFPNEYQATGDNGPQIPTTAEKLAERVERAVVATLKSESSTGATYTPAQKEDFIWYSYLFLGRGKPGTHLKALNNIDALDLDVSMPAVLGRLLEHVAKELNKTQPKE